MKIDMKNISPPSLLNTPDSQPLATKSTASPIAVNSLLDLVYDGFFALFMLKSYYAPEREAGFINALKIFLNDFEGGAKRLGATEEDIDFSKYAFCAAVDEIILRSSFDMRETWEQRPLQLSIFGDQLAGENFFNRLDSLRAKGCVGKQTLEVFHMCLLLGFHGKYLIEGPEKLNYLTARLGEEITKMKGKPTGFAPNAERPDHITNKLSSDVPIWVICSVVALIGLSGYLGVNWSLTRSTENTINGFSEVVKLGPRMANLTITLP